MLKMTECEYCKQYFNNKYTLKQHQKTAKFCLEIQGCAKTKIETFICEYCNKNLSSNERLYTHYNVCKEKSRVEITKSAYSEQSNY
jgi:uncharacterized CHY-type Zn-finger protein